jgi:uncharacterized membrane protein (UPF0127 family)
MRPPFWTFFALISCSRTEAPSEEVVRRPLPPPATHPGAPQAALPALSLLVGGHPVRAEVADDEREREIGLMMRTEMEPEAGMLFVYPEARPRSFWMKDTLLPLSIAYIDADGLIVSIKDMTPRELSPVLSDFPARFALEMNQGWFAQKGVKVGAVVDGLPTDDRE